MGAARLAWLAVGGEPDTVCVTPPVVASYAPQAAHHTALMVRHARFQRGYKALN